MLILECVEQKKGCKGSKWGGLLSISSLVLRHCNGVAIGGTMACTTRAPTRTTEDSRACAGVLRKAYLERPPWVLCRDREFPVATEMAHPVS